jgi:hypothetical protein
MIGWAWPTEFRHKVETMVSETLYRMSYDTYEALAPIPVEAFFAPA